MFVKRPVVVCRCADSYPRIQDPDRGFFMRNTSECNTITKGRSENPALCNIKND